MKALIKNNYAKVSLWAALGVMLVVSSFSASADEQLKKFVTSRFTYEEVTASVVTFNSEGGGQLRIYTDSCATCYEDAPFGPRAHLNTPLGHYYGYAKLADWQDKAMNVSVDKETGQVMNVRVMSYDF